MDFVNGCLLLYLQFMPIGVNVFQSFAEVF